MAAPCVAISANPATMTDNPEAAEADSEAKADLEAEADLEEEAAEVEEVDSTTSRPRIKELLTDLPDQ